ncbi:MFS transporter [Litorilinea aerophila]|uniref:MFS transporter n=1 Tax=Litorilinea aerophila TaxID=1204385 RepID=UPI0014777726|nr:MFS transporter [Litorilinea aerophila]MCC9078223.1 MFS transporter [Litorilinea aerophila]
MGEDRKQPWPPTRLVAGVGGAIGFCILGDSLLYSILPLEAANLGIGLPLVGLLLSVNRLVRLASNTWASTLYERMGPRRPFLAAVAVGLLSTWVYGLGMGFAAFLAARMAWGIAWSALRQGGYQAVWSGPTSAKGRLTGLLWGLVRLGSAVSVLGGGYLYDLVGYRNTLWVVTGVTALAVPLAYQLRWPPFSPARGRPPAQTATPVPVSPGTALGRRLAQVRTSLGLALALPAQRWLIVAAFFEYLLSGVVISTTSLFLASRMELEGGALLLGAGVATVTGLLHGTRWLTDLALGPGVGALSDRFGQANTALTIAGVLLLGIAGAVLLPLPLAIFSLLLTLMGDGALHIVMSAAATGAATGAPRPHLFIGVFTTTGDAGSALGPLLAYSGGTWVGLPTMYLAIAVALLAVVVRFWSLSPAMARAARPAPE